METFKWREHWISADVTDGAEFHDVLVTSAVSRQGQVFQIVLETDIASKFCTLLFQRTGLEYGYAGNRVP